MFSKAKRFDYPTPEAKTLPTCIRCVSKHNNCICSSNSKILIPISHTPQKKKNFSTFNKTNEMQGVFTIPASNFGGNVSDDSFYATHLDSICHSSADEGFHPSSSEESANILSTAPNSSSSDESHTDEEPIFSSASFTLKESCVDEVVSVDVHSINESSISCSFENDIDYDELLDQMLEASGLHSPDPTKQELLEYIEDVEEKIDDHRQKISDLRSELVSSSIESFVRTPSPKELSIQERLKNLEAMSKFCVKETLDFVILHNKNGEKKGDVRPDEYKELVDFCSSLIEELNFKLKGEEKVKKWPKMKKFVGRVFRPCGKIDERRYE